MNRKERMISALYKEMLRIRFRRWLQDSTEDAFKEWFDMVLEREQMMKLASQFGADSDSTR